MYCFGYLVRKRKFVGNQEKEPMFFYLYYWILSNRQFMQERKNNLYLLWIFS